jgi:hypothetical protein
MVIDFIPPELQGGDIPSAYARSALLAARRSAEEGEMAARAADVPAFAALLWWTVSFRRQRLATYAASRISPP